MRRDFSHYIRLYYTNPKGFLATIQNPVLLWEAKQHLKPSEQQWAPTETGNLSSAWKAEVPSVFEVMKTPGSKNPFAMGVTLGRVETNDLVIDDVSISRFHAYFQADSKSGLWSVVDAESKNGSWLNAVKLKKNAKTPVASGDQLKFGEIKLIFLDPAGLLAHLEAGLRNQNA